MKTMENWLTVRYVRIARWGDCERRAGMNREEAIAIIRKEYLCVDRDCDIERSCGKCDLMMPSKEPILEAYKIAIKALEQEPCEDAIDRKLVCAFIAGLISDDGERKKALQYINELPSVNPQPICEEREKGECPWYA
jgi:hypothetical protein